MANTGSSGNGAGSEWSEHDISDHLTHVPHARAIGMEMVEYSDGRSVVRVPYSEHLVGDPDTGVIHGGVITAALDNASGVAVPRVGLTPEQRAIATLDLRIDYMRPATPHKDLMITSECYQRTRSVAFVRAHAWQEDEDSIVASSVATFMLGANRAAPPGFAGSDAGRSDAGTPTSARTPTGKRA